MSEQGTIKWFSGKKGYGFITPTGCKANDFSSEVFVHEKDVAVTDRERLQAGDVVEFEMGERAGKTRATNVKIIRSGRAIHNGKPLKALIEEKVNEWELATGQTRDAYFVEDFMFWIKNGEAK